MSSERNSRLGLGLLLCGRRAQNRALHVLSRKTQGITLMSKLFGGIAALIFIAITAVQGGASAGWLSDAMGPADFVAGGQKWNVLTIETEDGFDSVTFLPAGKTAEQAARTLTLTAVIEEVPSSAYDAQAVLDQTNKNDNTTNYSSRVTPKDQSVHARGLYIAVPGRTYSQLFSLKGSYLDDNKTFYGVNYRINVIADSEIAKQPSESLDIMDTVVARISSKQIEDWFKYFYEKAKKRLAKKNASKAPKS